MNRREAITALMTDQKFSCSQAMVEVFCEEFGMDVVQARKMSGCFGGGMKTAGLCGAITGGIMVLGMKYSQTEPMDTETKQRSGLITREYWKRVLEIYPKVTCAELMGCDTSTPEGHEYAVVSGLTSKICLPLMFNVLEVVEGIIEE